MYGHKDEWTSCLKIVITTAAAEWITIKRSVLSTHGDFEKKHAISLWLESSDVRHPGPGNNKLKILFLPHVIHY